MGVKCCLSLHHWKQRNVDSSYVAFSDFPLRPPPFFYGKVGFVQIAHYTVTTIYSKQKICEKQRQ